VDVPTGNPNEKKTVSKFVVVQGDHVTFINKGSADAEVNFPSGSPLCTGNSPPTVNPILLPLTDPQKLLKVCVNGGEFKYTATVTGALPEDPILIVERSLTVPPSPDPKDPPGMDPIVFPEGYIYLALAAGAAFFVGLWVGMRRHPPVK
jgi:hypothetical protein